MMMHRMSPLMASDASDDDVSLTRPSPGKTRKRHGSPESWSRDNLSSESDIKNSPTEQTDDQGRTSRYMCPISSDVEDIPEKFQTRDYSVKNAKRQSTKSPHQDPTIRRSTEKIQGHSDISSTESESEHVEESQKSLKTIAKMSPKDSDQEFRNDVRRKGRIRKQRNSKQSNSCIGGSIVEDENTKNAAARQLKNSTEKFHRKNEHRYAESESSDDVEDVEERPKKHCFKGSGKKDRALKLLLGKSEVLAQPTEGAPSQPRVKKKGGRSPRKAVPIECEICGRNIRCKAVLERHMLSHTGEKPFECDVCGKHYTSTSNLRIHQLSHSGKMDYVCNLCDQKFTHLPYLKRHLLRHSGKKLHICEHCGKGFIQKYHLLRHVLVHTGQMPHICDKCGMSFNRTDYLKQHLRSAHLIESNTPKTKQDKLFHCETCSKSFASLSTLKRHKLVHAGATPYSCMVCARRFKQSSHLYSHMITHSNEKPHACNLCQLKFSRKSYVQKHKERVHNKAEVPQNC